MRFLPPLILHGAHQADEEDLTAHLTVYADRLKNYPDWPELNELLYKIPKAVQKPHARERRRRRDRRSEQQRSEQQ